MARMPSVTARWLVPIMAHRAEMVTFLSSLIT
jgi:hypothetical protein